LGTFWLSIPPMCVSFNILLPNETRKTKNMTTKIIANRFVLTVAAGLAACNLQAQSISASATLTETGTSGSEFEYSLVLDNTGATPINAFWYGWVQGSFDLPSTPTSITEPAGWTSSTSFADSVQFGNNTGSAIGVGQTGTFTFDSTSSLSAMTSGTTDGAATGSSVVYDNVSSMTGFGENNPPSSSGPFVPTAVPEPSSLSLLALGSFGFLGAGWRKLRR
jgi:PEP-CTERM motif